MATDGIFIKMCTRLDFPAGSAISLKKGRTDIGIFCKPLQLLQRHSKRGNDSLDCVEKAAELGFDAVEAVDFVNFSGAPEERQAKPWS